MKVAGLSGAKLDYWVSKARFDQDDYTSVIKDDFCVVGFGDDVHVYSPSERWSQGGPIIERENIQLVPRANGEQWSAGIDHFVKGGDTALIAAMRAYVSSKYGEDVPDAE